MQAYSLVPGLNAQYTFSSTGATEVTIRNRRPMKIRAIYDGLADLQFNWVSIDKAATWMFTPWISQPKPVQYTETIGMDGSSS